MNANEWSLPSKLIAPLPITLPWQCDSCGKSLPATTQPSIMPCVEISCQVGAPGRCREIERTLLLCRDCAQSAEE